MHSKDREKQWIIPWFWPFSIFSCPGLIFITSLAHPSINLQMQKSHYRTDSVINCTLPLEICDINLSHLNVNHPKFLTSECLHFLCIPSPPLTIQPSLIQANQSYILRTGISLSLMCVSDVVFSVHQKYVCWANSLNPKCLLNMFVYFTDMQSYLQITDYG